MYYQSNCIDLKLTEPLKKSIQMWPFRALKSGSKWTTWIIRFALIRNLTLNVYYQSNCIDLKLTKPLRKEHPILAFYSCMTFWRKKFTNSETHLSLTKFKQKLTKNSEKIQKYSLKCLYKNIFEGNDLKFREIWYVGMFLRVNSSKNRKLMKHRSICLGIHCGFFQPFLRYVWGD